MRGRAASQAPTRCRDGYPPPHLTNGFKPSALCRFNRIGHRRRP